MRGKAGRVSNLTASLLSPKKSILVGITYLLISLDRKTLFSFMARSDVRDQISKNKN